MNVVSALQWVEGTNLSTAIREGALLYRIDGFHLLAIAVIGGMLVMKDLRLVGQAMRGRNVSHVVEQLRVWMRTGSGLVVSSGLLLAWLNR